jgi:hypothetical protein
MDADRFGIAEAAARHGLSRPAAEALFQALISGGGLQAQFNHPELGGMGQWSGGMTQIGAMFDDALKARVGGFCRDMADAARAARHAAAGERERSRDTGEPVASGPATEAGTTTWWPAELGAPTASGAQNGLRYACFPERRRLAIDEEGRVTVYDTGDHRLTGFAQQQGAARTLLFSGPDGAVPLDRLRPVSR